MARAYVAPYHILVVFAATICVNIESKKPVFVCGTQCKFQLVYVRSRGVLSFIRVIDLHRLSSSSATGARGGDNKRTL